MAAAKPIPVVLIADDYPGLADMLAQVLELLAPVPLDARVALDGAQALAMALERPPAIAILDIDMPKMTGVQAARRMRDELDKPPLLIAVTGNPMHVDELRGGGLFDHVVSKPVEPQRLVGLIAALR